MTAVKYSNAFWDMPAITEPMRVNLLKSRCGGLWNERLAFMFNMPYLSGSPETPGTRCAAILTQLATGLDIVNTRSEKLYT